MRAALLPSCLLTALLAGPLSAATDPEGGESPVTAVERLGGGLSLGGSLDGDDDGAPLDARTLETVAPVGVDDGQLLRGGRWGLSLRTVKQRFDGLRDSNDRIGSTPGYLISPIDHTRRELRLDALFAPSDALTFRLSVPWIETEGDQQVNLTAERWTNRSKGLGDTSLTGLFGLWDGDSTQAHLSLGVSAPTGSITEEDRTVFSVGSDVQLPYRYQLGTGTWDVLPGFTITGQSGIRSWGVQAGARLHQGSNSQGYTRGDRIQATAWVTHHFDESQSASLRLAMVDWDETDNLDDDLPNGANPIYRLGATPDADPATQGGQRWDLLVGWNSLAPADSEYAGHRLAVEFGVPLRQVTSGPALELDWLLTVAWQKAF